MQIVSLVATLLVFLMWAASLFRTLFAIRARAVKRTGKGLPGPIDTLQEWSRWLRDPTVAAERRRLLLMTVIVMTLAVLMYLTSATTPDG